MNLDLMKTLKSIEKLIPQNGEPDIQKLKKAYDQTLRLRSQLISVIYDIEQYIQVQKTVSNSSKQTYSENVSKRMVTLTINEPLPSLKELTAAVEEHWIDMIHKAIEKESKTGIPKYKKAFVFLEITAPRGTDNRQVWDTSNRAINVVINNLKGTFFTDDDFEHMACGVVANWGEIGKTVIRICELEEFLGCEVLG